MNKILTLMTGLGLGTMLVYLSKKKSAPEFACDEVEEVIGASSSNLCKQANQDKVVDDSPSLQLAQLQCSDLAGLLTDRNKLVNAHSPILSRCISGCRDISNLPLARRVLPRIVQWRRL